MKRAFLVMWMAVLMTLAIAPAGVMVMSGTAQAACDFVTSEDGKPTDKCATGSGLSTNSKECPNGVKIGLPILNAGETCINNSAASGGAIIAYLKLILKLMSGAVGLVIVTMIVVAGTQYISSVGDPAQVKAAKTRLQNAILALVMFLSMFAILTFLVPGGIL